MPAGEYAVSFDQNGPFVQIQSVGGRESVRTMTYHAADSVSSAQAKLTFHRYGNQYFLTQSSAGVGSAIRGMVTSRAEQEAVKTASSHSVQTVILAAVR